MEKPNDEMQDSIARLACRHDAGHSCNGSSGLSGTRISVLRLPRGRLRRYCDAWTGLLLWQPVSTGPARGCICDSALGRRLLLWLCWAGVLIGITGISRRSEVLG